MTRTRISQAAAAAALVVAGAWGAPRPAVAQATSTTIPPATDSATRPDSVMRTDSLARPDSVAPTDSTPRTDALTATTPRPAALVAAPPPRDTGAAAAAPARRRSALPARCDSRSYRRTMRTGAATVFVGGNAALYEYFRRAWWSGERAPFHVDWERHEYFRQADKFGHMYGGYFLTLAGRELLEAACLPERKAAVWGAAYAAAFQLQIEIWDGFQRKYGFSPPDLIANTTGAALALTQSFVPATRAVKPTLSYRRTRALKNADHFPPGAQGYDLRPTVDYSGQTYWFSTDVDRLLPDGAKPYWPGILRLSVGRSITDWVNPTSGQFQVAKQVLVVSLDLDPEKLPGNNPLWRTVKKQLSYYHFPAPALVLTPSTKLHKWYR